MPCRYLTDLTSFLIADVAAKLLSGWTEVRDRASKSIGMGRDMNHEGGQRLRVILGLRPTATYMSYYTSFLYSDRFALGFPRSRADIGVTCGANTLRCATFLNDVRCAKLVGA